MIDTNTYHTLGIDGGGTGCRVAICSADGTCIAASAGGAANFTTSPAQTIKNVCSAIDQAASAAGLTAEQLGNCVSHVGLAGILSDADAAQMASALPLEHVVVTDDRQTSVVGALCEKDGILAAIGTGSFVAARRGMDFRFIGGWGLKVGDQASGAWIGRAALEVCLLVSDGLEAPSDLTQQITDRFNCDPVGIVAFASDAGPREFAGLAPLVIAAANADDPHARKVMQRGAGYLQACLNALKPQGNDIVCLGGGVGPHYQPYFTEDIRTRIRSPQGSALDGALRLARQQLERLDFSS